MNQAEGGEVWKEGRASQRSSFLGLTHAVHGTVFSFCIHLDFTEKGSIEDQKTGRGRRKAETQINRIVPNADL